MTTRTPNQYNYSKLEFNDRLLKKHFSPLNHFDKRYFVVHHMTIVGTGNGDALDDCYNTWQNREASAQYGVDGIYVDQFVLDKDYAWACGNTQGNLYGIHVEHANSTAGPKWLVDNATVLTGAKLIANGHILYKLGRPVDKKTLFQHDNFFATACPGPYLGGTHWDTYVKTTQRFYDEITGGGTPVDPPKPVVRTAIWGKPDTWILGAIGPDVKKLGERIVIWCKALGIPSPYKIGPGEPYGPADVSGLSDIQKKWWPSASTKLGGDADGYPGPESFKRLAQTPPKKEDLVTVKGLHWNVAGSDDTNGYGARNATRGDDVGRYAKSIGFDVFLACEAGQDNLRKGIDSVLGRSYAARAKAIWLSGAVEKFGKFAPRRVYPDSLFAYLNTRKWGAAFFGIRTERKYAFLEIHTDYRKPAKQAKQVQSIFKKFLADCDKFEIPRENIVVCGDFNWDGTSGDDPFEALTDWGFEEKGNRTQATFMTGKHLDGVLAHKNADVSVEAFDRNNLSDHKPLKFAINLH